MEMKKCTKCETQYPLDEFPTKRRPYAQQSNWCNACYKAYNKAYYKANKEKINAEGRRSHLKNKYGITVEQYDEMVEVREGKCDICGGTETHHRSGRMNVDHCHTTGKVRGLLCFRCNTFLGATKDSIDILKKAILYLEK